LPCAVDKMNQIDTLFDRMDAWRHFPNYQLERRADIFFSLYLPEVLEAKLGFPVRPELAPEFPVRIGTIYPNIPINKSYKIDITAKATESLIVYVQPNGNGPDIISFREFADVVERHADSVSSRFAGSLREWGEIQAGEKTANQASQVTARKLADPQH